MNDGMRDPTKVMVAVRTKASVVHVMGARDTEVFVYPAAIRPHEAVGIYYTVDDHAPFCEIAFR